MIIFLRGTSFFFCGFFSLGFLIVRSSIYRVTLRRIHRNATPNVFDVDRVRSSSFWGEEVLYYIDYLWWSVRLFYYFSSSSSSYSFWTNEWRTRYMQVALLVVHGWTTRVIMEVDFRWSSALFFTSTFAFNDILGIGLWEGALFDLFEWYYRPITRNYISKRVV